MRTQLHNEMVAYARHSDVHTVAAANNGGRVGEKIMHTHTQDTSVSVVLAWLKKKGPEEHALALA